MGTPASHTSSPWAKTSQKKKAKKEKKDKKERSPKEVNAILSEVKVNGAAKDADDIKDEEMAELKVVPKEALVPFANPLADVKKAAKHKALKRGVKEVVKSVRKTDGGKLNSGSSNPPGIVVLAADISPMDVISHIPVLCEDHNIPYIYVQSRAELGMAGSTKRPTSVVMVGRDRGKGKEVEDPEFKETYADLLKLVLKAGGTVKI